MNMSAKNHPIEELQLLKKKKKRLPSPSSVKQENVDVRYEDDFLKWMKLNVRNMQTMKKATTPKKRQFKIILRLLFCRNRSVFFKDILLTLPRIYSVKQTKFITAL